MALPRSGHAPDHVRHAFLSAIEAFMTWNDGEPEPSVEVWRKHVPHQMPISKVCGLLWNCNDILPGGDYRWLQDGAGIRLGSQTYAAAARAMRSAIAASPPAS